MKKNFTLLMGLFLIATAFAADRNPVVSINNSKNYKIVIDGKHYFGNNMTISVHNLSKGFHNIKVVEMRRTGFGNRERIVSATDFKLKGRDLLINIDRYGNLVFRELRKSAKVRHIVYDASRESLPARRF